MYPILLSLGLLLVGWNHCSSHGAPWRTFADAVAVDLGGSEQLQTVQVVELTEGTPLFGPGLDERFHGERVQLVH